MDAELYRAHIVALILDTEDVYKAAHEAAWDGGGWSKHVAAGSLASALSGLEWQLVACDAILGNPEPPVKYRSLPSSDEIAHGMKVRL